MKLLTNQLVKRFKEVGNQDGKGFEALVIAKFFNPIGSWTWYATEYEPETKIFFGYVVGFESEWGSFSLTELESIRLPLGLTIERDIYCEEKTLREHL